MIWKNLCGAQGICCFFFPSASQHNEIFHMGTQTVSKRAICASERNKYCRKQVKSVGTPGSVRPWDVVSRSKRLDSAGTPQKSLANNQHCNKSVWLRAARHLFHAHADFSNPLQVVTFRLRHPAQHPVLCLHQLFTISCLFHPCQYLIQELQKSYKHRKVSISH